MKNYLKTLLSILFVFSGIILFRAAPSILSGGKNQGTEKTMHGLPMSFWQKKIAARSETLNYTTEEYFLTYNTHNEPDKNVYFQMQIEDIAIQENSVLISVLLIQGAEPFYRHIYYIEKGRVNSVRSLTAVNLQNNSEEIMTKESSIKTNMLLVARYQMLSHEVEKTHKQSD